MSQPGLAPQPPQPSVPSAAIHNGAKLLLDLIESQRAEVSSAYQNRVAALEAQLTECRNALLHAQETLHSLPSHSTQELNDLRSEHAARMEMRDREIAEARSQLENARKEMWALRLKSARDEQEVEMARVEVSSLKQYMNAVDAQAKERKTQAEKELAGLREANDAVCHALRKEIVDLQVEMGNLVEAKRKQEDERAAAKNFEEEGTRLKQQISELREALSAAESARRDDAAELSRLRDECEHLRSESSRNVESLSISKGEVEELKQVVNRLEAEVRNLEDARDAVQRKCDDAVTRVRLEAKDLAADLSKALEGKHIAEAELEQVERKLIVAQSEADQLRATQVSRQSALDQAKQELMVMTSTVSSLRSDLAKSQEALADVMRREESLAALQRELAESHRKLSESQAGVTEAKVAGLDNRISKYNIILRRRGLATIQGDGLRALESLLTLLPTIPSRSLNGSPETLSDTHARVDELKKEIHTSEQIIAKCKAQVYDLTNTSLSHLRSRLYSRYKIRVDDSSEPANASSISSAETLLSSSNSDPEPTKKNASSASSSLPRVKTPPLLTRRASAQLNATNNAKRVNPPEGVASEANQGAKKAKIQHTPTPSPTLKNARRRATGGHSPLRHICTRTRR